MPASSRRALGLSKSVLILLILSVASTGAAQTASSPSNQTAPTPGAGGTRLQVGIRGLVGVPLGDFADNVETTGGVAGDFGYRFGDSPVSVGVVAGVLFHGSATRRLPLSLTIPDVLVDVTTSTRMVTTHGRIRIQPVTGRIRPYLDGLFGLHYVFTQTSADLDDGGIEGFDDATTTNLSDFALSVGGGGGVLVELLDWSDGRLSLDLGTHILYGGEAEYLVGGPDGFDLGLAGLDLRQSRTDILLVLIGVAVDF